MTSKAFVLRTDFSDQAAWEALKAKLQETDDELSPDLDFISDPAFADVLPEKLREMLPDGSDHAYGFIADKTAMAAEEYPVLAVELSKKKPKTFRVAATALAEVESNLSVANMEFKDFLKATESDGIFRELKS